MALSIPLWAVIVAAVAGFLVLLAVLLLIRQCRKMRARKQQEEIKAAEEFPPMRRLTIRRGQVVPAQKKRWSGVGSSIFGDRRSHRSRFSSVTDLEKAETSRSRSPFGIWPSSSYQAQQDGPSSELSSKQTKRTSTREGNMEFLRDVDRKFLRQLPTAHERESARKSRMSERSYSIPSIINARQFAEESPPKRPSTSHANEDTIEETEEPDSSFPSPDPNHSPMIYAQSNHSQDSLPSPTGHSFSRLGNHLALPKSKFSSARLLQRQESPAIPSPLSKSQAALELSPPDSPFNSSTSLPTTPRSLYSPQIPRQKEKSRLINQSHASNSTPTLPTTATGVIRKNSGISKKSPSPYGTVSTTISATNPIPAKEPRSRSKSRSPTRKSRSLSRSRSRTKSTLSAAPSRSQSRSKSRGRSPHPNTPTETDTSNPKLSAHLPPVNSLPASPALRSPYHFSPTNPAAGASSHSLSMAATRSNLDLPSLSFSDISSTFMMGQAQPQPLTILSPTAVSSFPAPPRIPHSVPPPLPEKDDKGKEKSLPRIPSGILPAIQPGSRAGDDVVMGVARSHSKKGRVLRKQSRKGMRETQKEKEMESVDKDA